MSLFIILDASRNLSSSAGFPITLQRLAICATSSSSLRIERITDPSKISVGGLVMMSTNLTPLHHRCTMSIRPSLNFPTYSSTSTVSLLSDCTVATRRAFSRRLCSGPWRASGSLEGSVSVFSSKTKQLSSAAHTSGGRSLNTPSNSSSEITSSSPESISQAARPLSCTTSSPLVYPRRRRTRFIPLSCCLKTMPEAARMLFLRTEISSEIAILRL
mmetsp:Transcript_43505/g.102186  ORF Transcript_43505/g.102186 Transcript_43505/m.102186 type:complete len:216 (-) Transcript_43505:2353-3000(-)